MKKIFYKILEYLPPKISIQIRFYYNHRTFVNFKNPRSFNEKLQWLKIYNRNVMYTMMVDKFCVKDYVAKIIGKEYIIPTLAVWDNPKDIEWKLLPKNFVLKTTHAGGNTGVVVCKDINIFDKQKAISQLCKSYDVDSYAVSKEWPYKNVKHRIIAEQYLEDESGYELKDYKFFCFNGVPRFLKVDFDRQTNHRANYYDLNWNLLPFYEAAYPQDREKEILKPQNFIEMVEIAKKLSRGIPFVRIDLYNVNGKIYFGEITFFPASGMGRIEPKEWNLKLGDYLTLPNNKTI